MRHVRICARMAALAAAVGLGLGAAGPATALSFFGSGFVIPDGDPAGASSTVNVDTSGIVTGMSLGMLNFQHSWIGDLSGTLTHAGITVDFMARSNALNSNNLVGNYTLVDSGSTTLINAAGPNVAPGTYAPDNPFSAFNGTQWAGDWTLNIADHVFIDSGSLGSWSLDLSDEGLGGFIPDGDATGFSSVIKVATGGLVDNLDIAMFGLQHTWMGDLVGTLTHNGVTVTWLERNQLNGDNLNGQYFIHDDPSLPTLNAASGDPRPSGFYDTFQPFSAFHGMAADGDWTLNIADEAFIDSGSFDNWRLDVSTFAGPGGGAGGSGAPEPGAWALLLLGFGAAGAMLRRRRPSAA